MSHSSFFNEVIRESTVIRCFRKHYRYRLVHVQVGTLVVTFNHNLIFPAHFASERHLDEP